ncbi:PHD finger protein ALFIN-LIKE 4 [Auxenochlorella protothecoides]|uniref:PHD finger protein ALFIN-LIKE 4 n=1 Tax=Auxenochlorella protothecoides TaxID=3075 RepID=A0A087SM68_AUXPR|nr:PHD finger protein ALFIN-LIKE 4 [Auxenochlorella protothecoides]KFM26822.1 PHD finger protein ALFIN-LIKE 4 [Auxenochlorella protothecoides]
MGPAIPKTLDDIYNDYTIRREALLTALTDDATEFYEACDPGKDNLCLYGHADGNWTVDLPADEVPPELPEPVLGINFARDGMERRDWMALCAVHSDAWLMSVLFFYAARFDDSGRAELFSLVNQHPTVYEVVTGRVPRTKINKRKQPLYWPDDGKWYLVEIHSVDPDTMEAKVQYATGEFEALDFDEVIPSGHMSLLAR